MANNHDEVIVLPITSRKGEPMSAKQLESGRVRVNGAELYYETRGDGPTLLLVAGGLADAGQFTALGEALAERCGVITYDRRGNSRSPAPDGWSATSVEEQADDAAALLEALGISAVSMYGHSIGVPIALDLAMRRPEIVAAMVLHDPAMIAVLEDPGSVMAVVGPVIEDGMKAGGPTAAADAFYGFAVGGAIQSLDTASYERMLGDGPVLFRCGVRDPLGLETGRGKASAHPRPRVAHCGRREPPFFREAADWLAGRLDATVEQVPGGHGAAFDHAADVAARIAACAERVGI
jgi:pimeloyl-ACP methyl ester carboxylesterase